MIIADKIINIAINKFYCLNCLKLGLKVYQLINLKKLYSPTKYRVSPTTRSNSIR